MAVDIYPIRINPDSNEVTDLTQEEWFYCGEGIGGVITGNIDLILSKNEDGYVATRNTLIG